MDALRITIANNTVTFYTALCAVQNEGHSERWKQEEIDHILAVWYIEDTMTTLARSDILSLSVAERVQLVEDIWDSVVEAPESVALTKDEKAELDRRLDAYHNDPGEGSPWGMVRERIKGRA